jgi:metallo-beta-lactamase class B
MRIRLILTLLLLLVPLLATAQNDETSRAMNQPVEPFKIAGNLYYVGASDVTSFLLTTPEGHILLDGGFEQTVPIIQANVKKLGFRLEDVKILLNSHAHLDHAGGLAGLKKLSGAKLLASAEDAVLLAAGGKGDFRYGDELTYPPVQPDRIIKDGETVTLGGTTLTAHLTPGHTKGCTTWTAKVVDGGKPLNAVFVCSLSINPGVSLTNSPKYPRIAEDYRRTFQVLESLPVDIYLHSHGQFFRLTEKAERARKGETPSPFIDPSGYRSYLRQVKEKFDTQYAAESQASAGPVRIGGTVSPPELVSSVPPEVPEVARKANVKGKVSLELIIDEKGDVTSAKVLKGLPMGLDRAAADAVKKWKYKPATSYGKPVKVYFPVTVTFPPVPEPAP